MAATAVTTESAANPFVILSAEPPPLPRAERGLESRSPLMPQIPLQDGEQYRFHFDMSKCVGCKCCEVACSEQNNNPAEISWRRVGEVEGGVFPFTQRLHLSMGCNHCVDPSCMSGCPTGAYAKDAKTGIVLHDADICIGCEYCIWNCPYSVPAFNAERGVVGKCDMCHGRLTAGDSPACVAACPSEALAIEIVDIAEWKSKYRDEANAPGLPSADDTISTTRVTLPADMPLHTEKADYHRVKPEKPHYSLVAMTVPHAAFRGRVRRRLAAEPFRRRRRTGDGGAAVAGAGFGFVCGVAAAPGPADLCAVGGAQRQDFVAEPRDSRLEQFRLGGGSMRRCCCGARRERPRSEAWRLCWGCSDCMQARASTWFPAAPPGTAVKRLPISC